MDGTTAEPAAMALADLRTRHAEPHRRYHTMHHVLAVLAAIDELVVSPEPALGAGHRALRLAAWFHDAVYDPAASANEAASAALARTALTTLGLPRPEVDEVARLIELTATHAVPADDPDGAVLTDADL